MDIDIMPDILRIQTAEERIKEVEKEISNLQKRIDKMYHDFDGSREKADWWKDHQWIGTTAAIVSFILGLTTWIIGGNMPNGGSLQTLCIFLGGLPFVASPVLLSIPGYMCESYWIKHDNVRGGKAEKLERELKRLKQELAQLRRERTLLLGKAEVKIDETIEEKTEPIIAKSIDKKAEKKKGLVARMAEKKAKKAEEKAKKAAKKAKEAKKKAKQAENKATRAEERAKKAAEKAKEAQAKAKTPNGQTAKKKEDTKEDSADSGISID